MKMSFFIIQTLDNLLNSLVDNQNLKCYVDKNLEKNFIEIIQK